MVIAIVGIGLLVHYQVYGVCNIAAYEQCSFGAGDGGLAAEFTYYVYQYRRAYQGGEVHLGELRQLYRAYSSGASEDKEYIETVAAEYVAEGYAYILLACCIHRHCKFGQ